MNTPRKAYPSDLTDDEWAFLVPYLALMRKDSPQRVHPLRDVVDTLRWPVRSGAPWRYPSGDFPPWEAVYQQARRWVAAGAFEEAAHDLRAMIRLAAGRGPSPSVVILDGRTLQSTPESGGRAGHDGAKRKNGSKAHVAVDTPGHPLAVVVTPASEQERHQVEEPVRTVQEVSCENDAVAFVDQGYTGETAEAAAKSHGIGLRVVKHAEAKEEFVLPPRRWVVERTFAWLGRSRRLEGD